MTGARKIALRTWVVTAAAVLAGTMAAGACSALGVADGGHDKAAVSSHHVDKRKKNAGSISLVAAPVGQTSAGRAGVTPGTGTFRPARKGRVVLIQGKFGSRWKTVSKVTQDRRGKFSFSVAKSSIAYRALAPKTKRDPKVVTRAVRSANWGRPTWSDEFTGSGALNPAIWSTLEVKRAGKFACVAVRPGNAYRQNGAAVLKVDRLAGANGAKTNACKYGQFGNAIVQAKNPQHQLRYGFAAARVKFAPVRGMHSAFWLDIADTTNLKYGDPRTGTEIDVAEYFGDGRPTGGLASFVHWYTAPGKTSSLGGEYKSRHLLPKKQKEWSRGWHVYSVEWAPSGYTFRVDGKVTLKTSRSVSAVPEKVLLSAITSDWEQPQMNLRQLPTVTKYDWVRVWQRPGS